MLQALEVVRRWIWVYGRIEWEAVRKGGDALEERMRLRHNDSDVNLPLLVGGGKSPAFSPPLSHAHPAGSAALDRRVSASQRKVNASKQSHHDYDPFFDDNNGNGHHIVVEPPNGSMR